MRSRLSLLLLVLGLVLAGQAATRSQQNPYRLKETDQRKLCVSCHTDFEQTLKKRHVHTAVASGECSGCHSAHVSSHGKMLSSDPGRLCASCHDAVVPANAKSTHQVVADGQCSKCHDPHASDHPANLLAAGNGLCVSCHADVGQAIAGARFKHRPVEQGCTTCHVAHASEQSVALLKGSVPGLCVQCHKPDSPAFVARHMKYPVANASCTSCHDPHGSNQAALLLDSVHAPVANRTCAQCHEPPDSATPFATRRTGFELCRSCHNDMVTEALAKPRLHWPVADREGCANCHNPHASKQDKLLRAPMSALCGSCHTETARQIAAATVKHSPVQDGMCTACHSPHSSRGAFLVDQPTIEEACGACHDYSQHSAHPIGEKAVDPRNPNLRVGCLSCHSGHGTETKHLLLAPTNIELCTPCHKQYSR